MSSEKFIVRCTYGCFRERRGVAVRSGDRWRVKFADGSVFHSTEDKFQILASAEYLTHLCQLDPLVEPADSQHPVHEIPC